MGRPFCRNRKSFDCAELCRLFDVLVTDARFAAGNLGSTSVAFTDPFVVIEVEAVFNFFKFGIWLALEKIPFFVTCVRFICGGVASRMIESCGRPSFYQMQ